MVGWDFDYNLDFQTVQSFQPENVESDYDAGASSQWDLILLLYFIRRITIEIAECVWFVTYVLFNVLTVEHIEGIDYVIFLPQLRLMPFLIFNAERKSFFGKRQNTWISCPSQYAIFFSNLFLISYFSFSSTRWEDGSALNTYLLHSFILFVPS